MSKKILLISIDFYEYNNQIEGKMCELGYEVDTFCQDSLVNLFEKMLGKINKKYLDRRNSRVQKNYVENLKNKGKYYDFIFVIKGDKLDYKFLEDLKQLNRNAKFILYLWDDVQRIPNFNRNKLFYDRIYSFDKNDSENYQLRFLPLFYCDEFVLKKQDKTIDVYFSGWEHSSRRKILDVIIPVLSANNLSYYFHLYSGRWQELRQRIEKKDFAKNPSYLQNRKLSLKDNAEFTIKSKAVIDIQHVTQNGLTMRSIESLASETKLITTNKEVEKYDFYNPQNILVIDRNNPEIDLDFIKSPYIRVPDLVKQQYSLTNWVKTILD